MRRIHEATSIALASTFRVGIVGALIAAVLVIFLREVPMCETFHMEERVTTSRPDRAPA